MIVVGLLTLPWSASPAHAQDAPSDQPAADERHFDIPAQPGSTAILRFADQAKVQLAVDAQIIADFPANAVIGRMTISAALDQLIAGTGLSWRYLGPNIITIEPRPQTPEAAISGAPRTFAPVRIEGRYSADSLPAGSHEGSDPTATDGTGSLAANLANMGAKWPRALRDTPQAISIITSARIEQQNLKDVSALLQQMPGISSRTVDGIAGSTFLSRGFEIHTFSFDGGGPTFYQSPLDANVRISLETPELAEFDHVEVLRGAAGLFGGIGYPGGVINLQRKRPLDYPRLLVSAQTGSWNNHLVEADVSMPLAFDGAVRGRAVALSQTRDFFYDVTQENRQFIYGTVEADIGPDVLIRVGASHRDVSRPGFNGGGLPHFLAEGGWSWPRDTCLCPDSNRYASSQAGQFIVAEWRIAGDWKLTLNGTRRSQSTGYKVGLVYASIAAAPPQNYLLFRSGFSDENAYITGDAVLSGTLRIAGIEPKLTAGFDYTRNRSATSGFAAFLGTTDGSRRAADLLKVLEATPIGDNGFAIDDQQTWAEQYAPYIHVTLPLSARLSIDAGLRKSFYSLGFIPSGPEGDNTIGVRSDQATTLSGPAHPTVALSYKLGRRLTAHLSYAKVFQPQTFVGDDDGYLPPLDATSYEARLHWVNNDASLNISAAGYYQKLRNYPEYIVGRFEQPQCCYVANDSARSYGLDIEAAGQVAARWQVQASYNWNRNRLQHGSEPRRLQTQQPEHQIKLWTTYQLGGGSPWSFGGGFRVESRRYSVGDTCSKLDPSNYCIIPNMQVQLAPREFSQPLYAVADVRVGRRISRQVDLSLSITNITDTRYYGTIAAPAFGNYFGEPRAFMISLKARFDH